MRRFALVKKIGISFRVRARPVYEGLLATFKPGSTTNATTEQALPNVNLPLI